jgi:hypothetical protein
VGLCAYMWTRRIEGKRSKRMRMEADDHVVLWADEVSESVQVPACRLGMETPPHVDPRGVDLRRWGRGSNDSDGERPRRVALSFLIPKVCTSVHSLSSTTSQKVCSPSHVPLCAHFFGGVHSSSRVGVNEEVGTCQQKDLIR